MRHQTYTDLVTEGDDDMIGRIAYSIYKSEKLAWIQSFEKANGQPPTEQDVYQYFHHAIPDKHDWYREEATRLVNDYIDIELRVKLATYRYQLRDEAIVKSVKKSFGMSILENLIAGFIGAGIIVLLNTGYWLVKQAPPDTLAKGVGKVITSEN